MYQANVVNAMPNNGSFERYRAERWHGSLDVDQKCNAARVTTLFFQEAYRLCDVGAMAEMVNIDKTQMTRDSKTEAKRLERQWC